MGIPNRAVPRNAVAIWPSLKLKLGARPFACATGGSSLKQSAGLFCPLCGSLLTPLASGGHPWSDSMRLAVKPAFAAAALLLAASCSTAPKPPPPPPEDHTVLVPPNAGVYKVGQPYQVDNVWYYPREQPDYDETGIASWYGPTFYGHHTANGEMYDGDQLTAAHKTLPMPVNVRVTNLDNGKSLVVRVNDRGPYARGRIIDLSKRAAELLDVVQTGTARVRVTYLARADINGAPPPPITPPAIASALPAAPAGKVDTAALGIVPGAAVTAPKRTTPMPTPAPIPPQMFADSQPTGQVTRVPVPTVTHLYVQLGAFSKMENAKALLAKVGGDLRISTLQRGGQTLYRVRSAPLGSVQAADSALSRLSGVGANDAHIVVDQ
jgi:rare lipoprotein A